MRNILGNRRNIFFSDLFLMHFAIGKNLVEKKFRRFWEIKKNCFLFY